jgi:hypothetical protein
MTVTEVHFGDSPANSLISQGVMATATLQERHLGNHSTITPKWVLNLEPPESRPCILTTPLLWGYIWQHLTWMQTWHMIQ